MQSMKHMRCAWVLGIVGPGIHVLVGTGCLCAEVNVWKHEGFEELSRGQFEDGGSNLYVNAKGVIETIHRWDVNNDGYVDLPLGNSHDYIERGPTHVWWPDENPGKRWKRQELSADSGWSSQVVDLDGDGFADLVIANGENGVTSRISSYVHWGGPQGLGDERTDLPTLGAYGVAVMDINHDNRLDLIFPSAWEDHHNKGEALPARVYLGQGDRKFEDATDQYGIFGTAAISVATADLNRDDFPDLVVANYRIDHNLNTESYVYWGTKDGLDTVAPLRLPTHGAQQTTVADLNEDGWNDVIFFGSNQVQIYWSAEGEFAPDRHLVITAQGYSSMFSDGIVRGTVADVDEDGVNDLILATANGVEIRSATNLETVDLLLTMDNVQWVTACDLDADDRVDLIVSRYSDGTSYDTESPVFWNGPAGFSLDRVSWVPTHGAVGNTAGDLDGDGRPEVIFNNTMSGHVKGIHNYIYLGNKDATYGVEHRLELPTDGSGQCDIADLDLDGYPEVIFLASTRINDEVHSFLRIYQGGPEGPVPGRHVELPTGPVLQGLQVADFNRDGFLDLLYICTVYDTKPESLAKSSGIYYGSEHGFLPSRCEAISTYGNDGAAADVNRDGYLDLLFIDTRGYVLIYLGGADGFSGNHTWKVPCPGLATAGSVNTADLNKDGWLDLVVGIMGHYTRLEDTLQVFYGSKQGFSVDNAQLLLGGYSPVHTGIADFNNDGNLDVLVTAYSSATSRVIPAQLFWGNGKMLDLEHPVNLPTESSGAVMQVDLNRDGWIDLFLACHRNDVGHQVDSLIYWNSPEGFSSAKVNRLPGLGPHGILSQDHGNVYTREPQETYISPPFDTKGQAPRRIHWSAEVPPPSQLKFQLRWGRTRKELNQAAWMGSAGEKSYYEKSGQRTNFHEGTARWIQYRAVFVSPYGCRSPQLREVRVVLKPDKSADRTSGH